MPMNSSDVMSVIDQIADEGSRLEKENILRKYIGDELFKRVMVHSYDPFMTYGIKPAKAEGCGKKMFDLNSNEIWAGLNALAKRALTGGDAAEWVKEMMLGMTPKSAELLWRILSRDLRCGITSKTINAVENDLIPDFTVMLAHKYTEKRITKFPVIVQPKLDGVRAVCLVREGKATFLTRSGKLIPALDHLHASVIKMTKEFHASLPDERKACFEHNGHPAIMLDGEVVANTFNETVSEVRRQSEQAENAEYHAFDLLSYNLFSLPADKPILTTYTKRLQNLRAFLAVKSVDPKFKSVPYYMVNSHEEIMEYYGRFQDRGLEGAMVKPVDHLYERRRSHNWLKMKAEETVDVPIIGAFEGTGKYEGQLGGLIINHKGIEVRVGSGLSDAQRDDLWKIWVREPNDLIGRLVEVSFHEITPVGSLRHPRFKRFRDDKTEVSEAA